MDALTPATALAQTLVDELARCGLTEAVISPGARSTPLALALAVHPGVRLHVRIDERSAAFLAVGLARVSRRPVAVVCTSGTAAANYHAAVLEADEAEVPLLVLTADRPPELRGTGANQTVDQVKLFGTAPRWSVEVGVPEPIPGMTAYWRSLACRAWAHATGDHPGPVHLNLAFRDPLVPDSGGGVEWPEPLEGRAGGDPWITMPARPAEPPPMAAPAAERGVIICGDGDYDPVPLLGLAAATGWPLLAEPTSGVRRGADAISTYRYLLGSESFVTRRRPELVVTVGRPTLSRQVLAYLRSAPRHIVIGDPRHFADPVRTATQVAPALAPPPDATPDTAWAHAWREAETSARSALDALLDAEEALSEPRLARDLAQVLPAGALLFAGSSMPVRDLDATMHSRCGLRLVSNRGVSGIDGTVSSAIGAALAHQRDGGGPAAALLGDLALLHDQNGLILGPGEPRPDLAIVVVNNDGGGIFSAMEQAGAEQFERLFGTPHGVTADRVAAMADIPYTRVEWADDLPAALAGEGLRLVEVRTSRADSTKLRARLQSAVDAAVG